MKPRAFISYCLVFICASVFFLFFSFPEEEAAARLSKFLSTVQSDDFQLEIQSVQPGLPNRLTSDRTALLIGKETRIVPDRFDLLFNPFHLVGAEKKIRFKAVLNEGRIETDLHLTQLNPLNWSRIQLNLSGIRIDRYQYDTELARLTINGLLNGNYMNSGKDPAAEQPPGKGRWVLQNASIKIGNRLFERLNLSTVEFPAISCEYRYDKRTIIIDEILARGPMINLSAKGKIALETPLNESRLFLQGVLLPDSAQLSGFLRTNLIRSKVKDIKKEGIGFTISGTILHPKIKI